MTIVGRMSWAFISDQFGKITPYIVSDYLLSLAVISLRIKTWLKNNDNNIWYKTSKKPLNYVNVFISKAAVLKCLVSRPLYTLKSYWDSPKSFCLY